MWATAKVVLRGKFIALNTYIRKHVSSQLSNLRTTSAGKEGNNKDENRNQ